MLLVDNMKNSVFSATTEYIIHLSIMGNYLFTRPCYWFLTFPCYKKVLEKYMVAH